METDVAIRTTMDTAVAIPNESSSSSSCALEQALEYISIQMSEAEHQAKKTKVERMASSSGTEAENEGEEKEEKKEEEEEEEEEGSSCICKFFKVVIGSPLLLACMFVSVCFMTLYIVLMPVKCCCPCGCIVGLFSCIMEKCVKLPMHFLKWLFK